MSRGLGRNQRVVVEALKALAADRGAGWVAPADLIERLEADTRYERRRTLRRTVRLINAMSAAARGDRAAAMIAHRLRAEGVSTSFRWMAPFEKTVGTRRPIRRACEGMNPSRILATLEKRGIVERLPCTGVGSRVRLVEV